MKPHVMYELNSPTAANARVSPFRNGDSSGGATVLTGTPISKLAMLYHVHMRCGTRELIKHQRSGQVRSETLTIGEPRTNDFDEDYPVKAERQWRYLQQDIL